MARSVCLIMNSCAHLTFASTRFGQRSVDPAFGRWHTADTSRSRDVKVTSLRSTSLTSGEAISVSSRNRKKQRPVDDDPVVWIQSSVL